MAQNPVSNMPQRMDYLAVSVTVTATAQKLSTLIETLMGYPANSLSQAYQEVTLQVDPETSGGASVRVGNGNLGSTVAGVVQKGETLVGGTSTERSIYNNVTIATRYVQTTTGTAVLNVQLRSF